MPFGIPTERNILKHIFKKTVFIPLPYWYLSLHDGNYNELSDEPGYERIGPFYADDFTYAIGGEITNITKFVFPAATGNWLRYAVWAGLWESETSEPLEIPFCQIALDTPYSALEGEIPVFPAGSLRAKMAEHDMAAAYGIYGHNALSDYLKDKLLNLIFGKETFDPPDLYVGLLTEDPGDTLENYAANEVPATFENGYWRAYLPSEAWGQYKAEAWNLARIQFPPALADWGTIKHFGIFDVLSPLDDGNALLHGPVLPEKVVMAGSKPWFEITIPNLELGMVGVYDKLGIGFEIL